MPRRKQVHESHENLGATDPLADLFSVQDIQATAFVVMMEAAKSAREDLKAIIASVEAVNAAKRHQRELLAKINRDVIEAVVADAEGREVEFSPLGLGEKCGYEQVQLAIPDPESPGRVRFAVVSLVDGAVTSRHHLEAAKEVVQGILDSMSELGEMESLRLQMAMERQSKMMETTSNLLKRTSETNQTITQNIK